MPRKAPDGNAVIEHRFSLSNYERMMLKQSVATRKLSLMPSIGLGLGVAGLGTGALLAGWAFSQWRYPGIIPNTLDSIQSTVEDVLGINIGRDSEGSLRVTAGVGGLGGVGGVLDTVVDASSDGLISLRREAQSLARERGEVNKEINAFCSIGSSSADVQKCAMAHDRKDAYFSSLNGFRVRVEEYVAAHGRGDGATTRNLIFGGLGDIAP